MTIVGEGFVALRPDATGFGAATESKLAGIFGAMSNPFGALVVGGVAVSATLLSIGSSFEDAFKTIRSQTGATAEQMDGLEESFKRVLASGPASMDQVASALSLVSDRTKLTGADLEAFTETELKLSRITKTDVKDTVDATTKALANFGIQGVGPSRDALDQLLAVSQTTGIGVNELASSVTGKAGASFRALGVDIGSAASIMGTLQAQGVDTGPVIMSLSKAITEAQKNGVSAKDALAGIFDTLKNGTPGTAAYDAAITSLGSRGFQTLRDAVQTGKITMDEFTSSMGSSSGQIDRIASQNQTLGGLFKTLKNQALVFLEPVATAFLNFANVSIRAAISALGDFITGIVDGFNGVQSQTAFLSRLGAVFGAVFSDLRDIAVSTFDFLAGAWDNFIGGFTGNGSNTWLGPVSQHIIDFGIIVRGVFDELVGDWNALVTSFEAGDGDITSSGWAGWFEQAGGIARQAFDDLKTAWSDFVAGFTGQGDNISSPLARFGEIVRTVADFVRDHWQPILLGVVGALGLLVAPISTVVAGLILLYQRSETFRDIVRETVVVVGQLAEFIGQHWREALALLAGGALGLVIEKLVVLYQTSQQFRDVIDNIADGLRQAFDYIVQEATDFSDAFSERFSRIEDAVRNVVTVIAAIIAVGLSPIIYLVTHFSDEFGSIIATMFDYFKSIVGTSLRIVTDIFDVFINLLSGNWGDAWKALADIPAAMFGFIEDSVDAGFSLLEDAFTIAMGVIGDGFSAAWDVIKALPGEAIDAGLALAKGAFFGMYLWVTSLPGALADAAVGLWDWIPAGLATAGNLAIGLMNGIIGFINSFGIHVHLHPPWPIPSVDFDWDGLGISELPYFNGGGSPGPGPKRGQAFHTGGVVPGSPGEEVWAKVLAGEVVVNPMLGQGVGGGSDMNRTNELIAELIAAVRQQSLTLSVDNGGGTPDKQTIQVGRERVVRMRTG